MGERRRLTKVEVLDSILFNMEAIVKFQKLIDDESNFQKINFYSKMIEKIKEANLYLCSIYRYCD